MPGITRINITNGQLNQVDWRFKMAHDHAPVANKIYRSIFNLANGDELLNVDKGTQVARLDSKKGIDVILTSRDNVATTTIQEKILTFQESTFTVEDEKTNGEIGAWYYCEARFYFIGYSRNYWDYKQRSLLANPVIDFQDWIMVDFQSIKDDTTIKWEFKQNEFDGRKARFRFIHFDNVPLHHIIARKGYPTSPFYGKYIDIIINITNDAILNDNNLSNALYILNKSIGIDRYRIVFKFDNAPTQYGECGFTNFNTITKNELVSLLGYNGIKIWKRLP